MSGNGATIASESVRSAALVNVAMPARNVIASACSRAAPFYATSVTAGVTGWPRVVGARPTTAPPTAAFDLPSIRPEVLSPDVPMLEVLCPALLHLAFPRPNRSPRIDRTRSGARCRKVGSRQGQIGVSQAKSLKLLRRAAFLIHQPSRQMQHAPPFDWILVPEIARLARILEPIEQEALVGSRVDRDRRLPQRQRNRRIESAMLGWWFRWSAYSSVDGVVDDQWAKYGGANSICKCNSTRRA